MWEGGFDFSPFISVELNSCALNTRQCYLMGLDIVAGLISGVCVCVCLWRA